MSRCFWLRWRCGRNSLASGRCCRSIQHDLGVPHAVAGLLGTIPVLCMGLFAPPASYLSGRIGSRHAIAGALALIGVFGVVRSVTPGAVGVILLTFPVGVGMGLAGAILPVTVKERFPDRPGFATGVYTSGITIGSAVAAASAVPLAHLRAAGARRCLSSVPCRQGSQRFGCG